MADFFTFFFGLRFEEVEAVERLEGFFFDADAFSLFFFGHLFAGVRAFGIPSSFRISFSSFPSIQLLSVILFDVWSDLLLIHLVLMS